MGDRARVEWDQIFNDGPDCKDVDFIIMIHPKNDPSAYQMSDFTLKGERKGTLKVDPEVTYVFQVIAREDKGDLGIDYKYSDMITNPDSDDEDDVQPQKRRSRTTTPSYNSIYTTTTQSYNYLRPQTKALPSPTTYSEPLQYENLVDDEDQFLFEEDDQGASPASMWYIYECVPFIKDLEGYDETSGSQNRLLEKFIKQMNTKPLEIVNEFISKDKDTDPDQCKVKDDKITKGYLKRCDGRSSQEMCCNSPWSKKCDQDCYLDYSTCDGNRCIPGKWVQDGWPDCLDGSDEESPKGLDKSLPEQLVCIQCAGVVLSAGFVCRESRLGLSDQCIQEVMGEKGACNNCISYYFNLG